MKKIYGNVICQNHSNIQIRETDFLKKIKFFFLLIVFISSLNICYAQNINVTPPNISAISRCGSGPVTFNLSEPGSGKIIKWFLNINDTVSVSSGTSFTTDTYSKTDTIFAAIDSAGYLSKKTPAIIIINNLPLNLGTLLDKGTTDENVIGDFPFDGTAVDLTGNVNNITVNNATPDLDRFGNKNGSYYFNGIDNSIIIPHNDLYNSKELTISFWMKKNDSVMNPDGLYFQTLLFKDNCICKDLPFGLWIYGSKPPFKIYFIAAGQNDTLYYLYSKSIIYPQEWHYITTTINNSNVSLYIDGVLVGSKLINTPIAINQKPIILGYNGSNRAFNGNIDDLKLYNRVLSDKEIKILYNLGNYIKISCQNDTICQNAYTNITLYPSQANISYQLENAADLSPVGPVQTGDGGILFFNTGRLNKTTSFKLLATDLTTGCDRLYDTTFTIIVNSAPTADFSYSADSTGLGISFSSINQSNNLKYNWNFGDGYNDNKVSSYHVFKKSKYFDVSLNVVDNNTGCVNSVIKPVKVGNGNICKAKIYYSIAGNTINFADSSIGNPTSWYWQFGDGGTSSLQNPSYKLKNGIYNVKLEMKNDVCSDIDSKTITIGTGDNDCEASFEYYTDIATYKVSFNNTSMGNNLAMSYWNFGDNKYSNFSSPEHKFTTAGYYDVCLSVWTADGSCYNTRCKTIEIGGGEGICKADFIKNVDVKNKKVTLTDNSFGNISQWKWEFGDTYSSSLQNVNHLYSKVGLYLIHLRVKDTSGCISDKVDLINIDTTITGIKCMFGNYIQNDKFKAKSYPVEYKGSAFGDPARFEWNFGDQTVDSTTINPNHVYNATGNYNVCLTVIDPVTNQSDQYCKRVIISDPQGIQQSFDEDNNSSLLCYPNPFSNTATIVYQLNKSDNAELSVYNIIGNKILTIINSKQSEGLHSTVWNAEKLSKGIYFIQLKTSDKTYIKKMILIE